MSDEGSFDLVDLDAGFDQHAAKMTTSNDQTPQKSADPAQAAASATPAAAAAGAKTETTTWKKKVKTELCRFWLNG